jgi:hypothetical protein
MNRLETLKKHFKDNLGDITVIEPLIEKVVMLEEDLAELEKLPRFLVNRNNPQLVKEPPHFKMWKEKYSQYTNSIKVLQSFTRGKEVEEESPLEAYLKSINNN